MGCKTFGVIMDIPSWFGPDEYYWLLRTVWFTIIMYLLITVVKVKSGIKVKESFVKVKSWLKNRKLKKEEKILGKPLE